jgi:DNA-binding HxlR family transcriptional regulator
LSSATSFGALGVIVCAMTTDEHTTCPVSESIELLQEKWVLHIIRSLLEGPRGFNELARAVGGVNTTTLAARLEMLEREGIVTKTIESTMPPRTRYRLSTGGVALQEVIEAIDRWARTHLRSCRASAADPDRAPATTSD